MSFPFKYRFPLNRRTLLSKNQSYLLFTTNLVPTASARTGSSSSAVTATATPAAKSGGEGLSPVSGLVVAAYGQVLDGSVLIALNENENEIGIGTRRIDRPTRTHRWSEEGAASKHTAPVSRDRRVVIVVAFHLSSNLEACMHS